MPRTLVFASLLLSGLLAGCGARSLDTPENVVVDVFPAGQSFTLTLLMKGCSDTCSTYEPAECSVSTADGNVLEVDVSVPYGDKDGTDGSTLENCSLACGAPVYAGCAVPALAAGTWSVQAGTFRGSIEVK